MLFRASHTAQWLGMYTMPLVDAFRHPPECLQRSKVLWHSWIEYGLIFRSQKCTFLPEGSDSISLLADSITNSLITTLASFHI